MAKRDMRNRLNFHRRVGVDVDGVLADFLNPALRLIADLLNRDVRLEEATEWDFVKTLVPKELLPLFWSEVGKQGCRNMAPIPGAVEGISRLAEKAGVYIVTSPLHSGREWTTQREEWLAEHFGIHRSKVIHTSAKYTFSGKALIDDNPLNVEEWAYEHEKGIPVLWETPYNKNYQPPSWLKYKLVRTSDWNYLVDNVL